MKRQRGKSQTINLFNSCNIKETLIETNNPGLKDEYEILIKDLAKSIKKQLKMKPLEKDNNKENNILTNINLSIIQYILNKKKRSSDELLIIKTFLSRMEFLSSLNTDITTDKLLLSLSNYVKLERKSQNNIIFRYGDKGNRFYIIFSGELSVLILKETKARISYIRYFIHLIILKLLKENELLYKIISSNFGADKVNKEEFDFYFDNINKLVNKHFGKFTNKNRYFIVKENNNINNYRLKRTNTMSRAYKTYNAINDIDVILDSECSSSEEEEDNEEEKKDNNSSNSSIRDKKEEEFDAIKKERKKRKKEKRKELFKKNPFLLKIYNINKQINYSELLINHMDKKKLEFIVLYFIYCREALLSKKGFKSIHEYINYTYLNSSMHISFDFENYFCDKEEFTLFQYFEITKLKKGDTFGELALQHSDNKRTGTIMTYTDTVLGYLSKNDYELSISDIELKRRKKNVNFIMSFSIFSQMNWYVFENKYFNFFKKETFNKGDRIMAQGQKNSELYFIMDGQFEITTSMALKNIYSLLKIKMGKTFDLEPFPLYDKNFNFRIYISNNKDLLGLSDCYYRNNISFINATCISLKSTVLTVDISILNELREKNPEIEEDLQKMISKKQKIMIERLKIIYYKSLETLKFFKLDISSAKNKKKKNLKINEEKDCFIDSINLKEKEADLNKEIKIRSKAPALSIPNINKNLIKFISKKNNDIFNSSDKLIKYREKSAKKESTNYSIDFNNELLKNQMNIINIIKKESGKQIFQDLCESKYNNEDKKLLKFHQIMLKKKDHSLSGKNKFILKSYIDKINNKSKANKIKEINSPINKIINQEYSKLFNWIEDSINNKNNSRYYNNKCNTEEQSFDYEKLINNDNKITNRIFQKEYSSKLVSPIKPIRKNMIKLKSARKKQLANETYNITTNNSLNKDKNKRKSLSYNNKKINNIINKKRLENKNTLAYREKRLKKLFSKFIQNESFLEKKPNKRKLKNNFFKSSKCSIISNIHSNNDINNFGYQKVNFFLCSDNTKKEFGLDNPKLFINNNILLYYYPNSTKQHYNVK